MSKRKNQHGETIVKTASWTVITVFVLICLIMGLMCFQYYRQMQATIKGESEEYLQEVSKQMGKNASKTINDNFAVLGTISSVLKSSGVMSYNQIQPIVLQQQRYWNYQSMMLVDANGVAYNAYGEKVNLGNDTYLRDVIINGQRSMSPSQLVDGQECIVFAIPLEGVTIDGKDMRALAATYNLTTFDQIISMSAFEGKAYAHIIQQDGAVVVRSSSKFSTEAGYNVLTTLSRAEAFDAGISFDKVKSDIENGVSGIVGYTLDGIHKYLVYTPLESREWCLLTIVPSSAVNSKSEIFLNLTLLLCSVITLVFAVLLSYLMSTFYRHRRKLEQIAYVDPVTGGNTIQKFYEQARVLMDANDKPQYALIYTNVEKFKVLNEQFGRKCCDDMLCSIEKGISKGLSRKECMGRYAADNFCVLAEYSSEKALLERLERWYKDASLATSSGFVWLSPILEFGVYVISNDSMEFPYMIDRAKLALREASNALTGRLRYAIYDDVARQKLFREKHLEDMMDEALKNHEFQVYLQPKYNASTETIQGAEALVRWVSASEGMIYPDEFISLFEKNGFICVLDMYVFEQVCLALRRWLDEGREPMKVSVNCSRIHLNNPSFLDSYLEISKRCGVPTKYLEIELTENIVFEDVSRLTDMIHAIHGAGFGCSMDDFGSGYSSLNLIQDIPVDTIKLDKIFFNNGSRNLERTESVVGSILAMARALNMATVAEGVEEEAQLHMLRRLGCDYIQGYYFARPMPIADFERLAFGPKPEGGQ